MGGLGWKSDDLMTSPTSLTASPLSLEQVNLTFHPRRSLSLELSTWLKRLSGRPAGSHGIQAVRGVNLALKTGEILAIVGESGSGKTTLGRLMTGLYHPDSGRVLWAGREVAGLNNKSRKNFRRRVQIIFQDPGSSLNPRFTAKAVVEEALIIHNLGSNTERHQRVAALLKEVGLPTEAAGRFSHEFSGGQRQRLSLARALALDPEILIADEPVSALDVSIQAQIINLLLNLRTRRALTLVFISHDLPLVRIIADRLAIMYSGRLMEVVDKSLLGKAPHHPYVLSLWASASGGGNNFILKGEPPDPASPPPGCPFAPRCREAIDICHVEIPLMTNFNPGFACACHRRRSPTEASNR